MVKTEMKTNNTMINMKLLIFSAILTLFISVSALPTTKTWTGSVSTDWANGSNWTPVGVPLSADDVTIPTSPTGGRMPIISSGTFYSRKLTIELGATLTQSGGTITPTETISIYGSFIQNSGSFITTKAADVYNGGNFKIAGSFSGNDVNVLSGGTVNVSGSFTTNGNKITIDGGTFNQTSGTVATRDMELKNGGVYNQSGGEFQIEHDMKVPEGTSFNGTSGTVRFTGAAGAGATYTGNVQFNNLIVDAGADYNLNDGETIKISGNYTNNNSSLKDEKGTLYFNGTSSQTFFSASPNNIAGNIIVSNAIGVTLLSDMNVKTSFTLDGGHVHKNGHNINVNGIPYEGPTPVELVSFNAKVRNNAVILNWQTATEINNYGFEIERSKDRTNWDKIGFVNGHGNSNSTKEYSFEDSKLKDQSYSYRLKQVDNDGTFAYSKVVSVAINQAPASFELYQNYPNPFNPSTIIKYAVNKESFVTIKVYNVIGGDVATLVNENLPAGLYEASFDGSGLSSGVYIYKIQTKDFSSTKKMLLTK